MLSKLHARFIGIAGHQRYSPSMTARPSLRKMFMGFSTAAAALWFSISLASGVFVGAPSVRAADAPGDSSAPATAKTTSPAASPAPSSSGDAAAKHAKRTACLKDAKTKKLVGAKKTSFLKNCIAAP
jgi:hypothetical protein